ncbi:MAG: tetratricopeptide repeat protein [Treponema sp.]|jgi:tetratricopeptide (TPR) repeat protein|nr:tetratricopeptide repeat protein [Treponema sp.]
MSACRGPVSRLFFALIIAAALPLAAQQAPDVSRYDALQNYRAGRDLEGRNRMEEAERYYTEAVRICRDEIARNAGNMDSYTVLTWALQRQRKYADVITWGERALRIASDMRITETMGEAYFYLNNHAESLRFMQRYVNVLPQGDRASVAYFFIGEIYRLSGKWRHADVAYTTAVRLEPGAALWWYRLGTVRESAGEGSFAVEAYERALALNPNYREASEALLRVRRPAGGA